MIDVLLFGGTSEGRTLAELLKQREIPTLVCVATEYGESLLEPGGSLTVHTGRLDAEGIQTLFLAQHPSRVVDATHPYAQAVSENLRAACHKSGTAYLRLRREPCAEEGCIVFHGMDDMITWLNTQEGVIFSMLGAKEAHALTRVDDYQTRVYLRVLPSVESLTTCLNAGFPSSHIICMQGPFSEEMNTAMLRAAGAHIVVTKESGMAGGFPEKLSAAKKLGIPLAVLQRPTVDNGYTLSELISRIEEGAL